MSSIIFLIVFGVAVGMLTILLGGGGGAIYLGILTGVIGLNAANAASTSLVTSLPPLIIGAISYYRQGKIDIKIGNQMLIAALPSVVAGSILSHFIPDSFYKWIIGLIMIILGVNMLRKTKQVSEAAIDNNGNDRLKASLYGCLAGLMVGVAGMSGGAVITAGLFILGLETFNATATSTYVLAFMSTVGMLFHLAGGSIDWYAGLPLTAGAIVGAIVAPMLASGLAKSSISKYLKPFIGIMLVLLGIKSLL